MNKNDITSNAIFKNKDFVKCAGQSPERTMVCAYRQGCKRYVMPTSNHQAWSEFWKGGDDCASYISLK